MAPRFLQCLLKKKRKFAYPKDEETGINLEVQKLLADNMALQKNLQAATETISELNAQLAEYDLLLAHSYSQLGESMLANVERDQDMSGSDSVVSSIHRSPKSTIGTWVYDLWLCSDHGIKPLYTAEHLWRSGDPDAALQCAGDIISSNPFLSFSGEMLCRVFIAATLHAIGEYKNSNAHLKRLFRILAHQHSAPYFLECRDVVGAAYSIQGRNLMALEEYSKAYWSLSRALNTPGYHYKARKYQKRAIECFTRKVASGDTASSAASVHPILGHDQGETTEYLDAC
ncbi:hypothetical protein N7462_004887 [Penicillium macrosclerotiorum]|uniref:uncharacterized protein n=1 Tax=Penicillium macrosclerotiorum TaxID=303699 RepID=UPI002546E260|nr:uncharacterized protein N7462_004887 [Penicillium macrosclerotiorum]KAJ5690495.1 hypothetical protein N7462_004887 [Penicillium macrosclerotiorum]